MTGKQLKIKQIRDLLAGEFNEVPITITVIDENGNDFRTGLPVDLSDDQNSNEITGFVIKVKKSGNSTIINN